MGVNKQNPVLGIALFGHCSASLLSLQLVRNPRKEGDMLRSSWITFLLIVVICWSQVIAESNVNEANTGDGVAGNLVPLMEDGGKMEMIPLFNETRRKLGSFQICAVCTCCGGPRGVCLPSPCCYAINCNIPNRPFGFCAFTPKICNCFGCHL